MAYFKGVKNGEFDLYNAIYH